MYKLHLGQQAIWNNAIVLLRIWVGVILVYHEVSIFHSNNMQSFAEPLQSENIPFPFLAPGFARHQNSSGEFFS
jgi:hypothetical protein